MIHEYQIKDNLRLVKIFTYLLTDSLTYLVNF